MHKTPISRNPANCNSLNCHFLIFPCLHFLLPIFRTQRQMTTTFLIREVNDVADVCDSVDVLVGGCLGGRVSDRELPADTGKEYK